MAWVETPCVSKMKVVCCQDVKSEATVVIHGGPNIISIGSVGGPQCTHGRIVVDECFSAKGSKQHFSKIKWLVQLVIRGDLGIVA